MAQGYCKNKLQVWWQQTAAVNMQPTFHAHKQAPFIITALQSSSLPIGRNMF